MEADRLAVHGKPEPSRALVPVGQGSPAPPSGTRPLATFVAQIMACEARVPDLRQHRRSTPAQASARYECAHQKWSAPVERVV
jgi:hypothetical protein